MKTKFKIWTVNAKETHSDDYCYLRLDPGIKGNKESEAVAIVACDVDGKQLDNGIILILDSNLRVIISVDGISHDIPLKTDITDTALIYTEAEANEMLRPLFRLNLPDIMARMTEHAAECPTHGKEPTIN